MIKHTIFGAFVSIETENGVFAFCKDMPSICCSAANNNEARRKLKVLKNAYQNLIK